MSPRFARHVMLAEIGARGQETLSSAQFHLPVGMDARAASIARTYLGRAGLVESPSGREVSPPLSRGDVNTYASAYLLGALSAVEHIKAELGLGLSMTTLPSSY